MAREVNAEYLLLERKELLPAELADVRERDLTRLLLLRRHEVKQGHLSRDALLAVVGRLIEHARVDLHQLLSRAAEAVERAGLDQVLDRPLVHILPVGPRNEVADRRVRAALLPLLDECIDDAAADRLDRVQAAADRVILRKRRVARGLPCIFHTLGREAALALIDGRRQDLYAARATVHQIFRAFSGVVDDRRHERRHVLDRIIALQIGRLHRDDGVRRRVRLVERVLREVRHLVVDVARDLLADPVCDAAGDIGFRIAVNEFLALLRHDLRLFLRHRAADQIGPSHRVAGEIADDLHDLLLIDDAAVRRFQNRLHLRAVVADALRMLLALNILRNKVHRARAVERDSCDDVLERPRLQLLHE